MEATFQSPIKDGVCCHISICHDKTIHYITIRYDTILSICKRRNSLLVRLRDSGAGRHFRCHKRSSKASWASAIMLGLVEADLVVMKLKPFTESN